MGYQSNVPGPGERSGLNEIEAEPSENPVYDGLLSGSEPVMEHDAHRPDAESDEMPDAIGGPQRRTSTDRDDLRAVRVVSQTTECRTDHTAHDHERESRFDAVQDDRGPTSDQSE